MQDISSAIVTGFTTATTNGLKIVADVLPQALIVTGVMLGITIGYRAYKKIAK